MVVDSRYPADSKGDGQWGRANGPPGQQHAGPLTARHIRVLLAGEHRLLQDAIVGMLALQGDIRVLAAVANPSDALYLATELRPHVVLLEPWSEPGAVHHTVHALRGLVPHTAIVLTPTTCVVDSSTLRAVHRVLPRDAGRDVLLKMVRALGPGDAESSSGTSIPPLSRRESEVLSAAAKAMTNHQIARLLGITTGTVKRHMHAVFQKLGAVSRLDAVAKAYQAGLLGVDLLPADAELLGAFRGAVEPGTDGLRRIPTGGKVTGPQ
ncbi:response regulator transcription factor [Streptomyces sp. M2CJ-2]|uniref:response regulator transcription factor n=1 Tax=Streptomyces sp. M2CJ-2 TaxID=2803948 RepID=UPI001925B9F2|nr:response regulator transcription factor [Streptomyces sp. M2CJ-2]MBL3667729.1 response regulator transcription factor [Streptomyces sp. M2CJ-2]